MDADGKEPVCTLKLLVDADLAKAIIGTRGEAGGSARDAQ